MTVLDSVLLLCMLAGRWDLLQVLVLIYASKSTTTDYHNPMNYEHYSKWVQHQMIPGLPEMSIVVIANAPYHNQQDNIIP